MRQFRLGEGALAMKLEQMQRARSFKARGAFANLLLAKRIEGRCGGGFARQNYGTAVAYPAQRVGQRATLFAPGISPYRKCNVFAISLQIW
jgi:threonine dehydratase